MKVGKKGEQFLRDEVGSRSQKVSADREISLETSGTETGVK